MPPVTLDTIYRIISATVISVDVCHIAGISAWNAVDSVL